VNELKDWRPRFPKPCLKGTNIEEHSLVVGEKIKEAKEKLEKQIKKAEGKREQMGHTLQQTLALSQRSSLPRPSWKDEYITVLLCIAGLTLFSSSAEVWLLGEGWRTRTKNLLVQMEQAWYPLGPTTGRGRSFLRICKQ
jgi:hypothetical protein